MTGAGQVPAAQAVQRMSLALAHRGPDGTGHYRAGNLAMVQRRLAIIDLRTGDQPLFEPGGAALIANGEIYNYRELREGFDPASFATQSDCEVPLHLYRQSGLDFTRTMRGMYAVAIHDASSGRLVLARDPFGIKPLYYAQTPEGFAFASEPQAILAAGLVERTISSARRDELLQLQFTTGRETIFAGINRVLPGETIVVQQGQVIERRRRPALPEGAPVPATEEESLVAVEAALVDSVRMHQRSDVPYGMFLSGGIDSTAVLAAMTELNERPVQAFTLGFESGGLADERAAARRIAHSLHAKAEEVSFSEADFWTLLPTVAAVMDDPVADYAVLPTYKLAAAAQQAGIKVVLSGEGGDELFAGYGRYRSVMRPWWQGGRLPRSRGNLDGLGLMRRPAAGWRDGIAAAEVQMGTKGRTRLQVAQAADCAEWLPNDLMTKLDRCLMAHGVEGRTPFLDPQVAAAAFRLPDDLKVRRHTGKYLLRKWVSSRVPEADAFGRKRGFSVPVGHWIAENGRRLGPLVAAQPGVSEMAIPEAVERLFAKPTEKHLGFAAWTLLFYAVWHQHHIVGLPVTGDVWSMLEQH